VTKIQSGANMIGGTNSHDASLPVPESMHIYDHVISLGPNCAVAHNLRRFFRERYAFPFDWWITYDANGFACFLKDLDLDKLYNPNELHLGADKQSVIHSTYGVEFYHEFASASFNERAPVVLDYLAGATSARRRTSYLVDRLKMLHRDSSRLLFVRATEPCEIIPGAFKKSFPLANWEMAFLGRVQTSQGDWRGDPSVWDTTLKRLSATLDSARLPSPTLELHP